MNKSHSRLKRVSPERSGPIRNQFVNGSPPAGPQPISLPGAALKGALECGVHTAYAVIDEYMKRGYEAARSNQNQNGKDQMNNEKTNYGSPYNPWGPMTPLMEQWSAAFKMWTDALTPFMAGMRPGGFPWPMSGAPSATPYASAQSAVSVQVSSLRPTEVTVNLKPGTDLVQPVADSFVPPLLNSVSIAQKPGCVQVSVTIADQQAAGRYCGVIRNSDGSVAGDLMVVVSAAGKTSV